MWALQRGLVVLMIAVVSGSAPGAQTEPEPLIGEWVGKDEFNRPIVMRFGPGNEFRLQVAGQTSEGVFAVDWGRRPAHLDITMGAGLRVEMVVERKGDRLFVENNEPGRPRPSRISGKALVFSKRGSGGLKLVGVAKPGPGGEVAGLAISSEGRWIVASDLSTVNRVIVWDGRTGFQEAEFKGNDPWTFAIVFSPDGKRLATGGSDGRVVLWEAGTWKEVDAWGRHDQSVLCLAYSPDGRYLVSGGLDGQVLVAEAANGKRVADLAGHPGEVNRLAFSRDGRRLVSTGKDKTLIWDTANWRQVGELPQHPGGRGIALAPDGSWALGASDKEVVR